MDSTVKLLQKLMLIHAVMDWVGGALLLVYPDIVGLVTPDDFAWSHYGYRFFAAGLLSIGTASYLASKYTNHKQLKDVMLWKSVWAGFVSLGIIITFAAQQQPLPIVVTLTLIVFLLGFAIWLAFYLVL